MKPEHEINWNQYEFSKPMVVQMHDRVTDDLRIGSSPVLVDFSVFSGAKKLTALAIKAGVYDKYDKAYILLNLGCLQNLRVGVAVNHMGDVRMTVRAYGKKPETFEIKLSFPERVALLECLDIVCMREVGSTLETLSKICIMQSVASTEMVFRSPAIWTTFRLRGISWGQYKSAMTWKPSAPFVM